MLIIPHSCFFACFFFCIVCKPLTNYIIFVRERNRNTNTSWFVKLITNLKFNFYEQRKFISSG